MKQHSNALREIAFFSTMAGTPWGASEELWSQSAWHLAAKGFRVTASIKKWGAVHPKVRGLMDLGITVIPRAQDFPLPHRIWRKIVSPNEAAPVAHLRKLLETRSPSLVVFSDGFILPPVELMELCVTKCQPFVTISHSNSNAWWADDREAERYRQAIKSARRCYFVSKANLALLEKQIAFKLPNAEVIWSPVNVRYDASPPFPPYTEGDCLRLASVGRLHPPSKGQDVLIEALAGTAWRARNWRLNLYGEGNMKQGLADLARRFGLSDKVTFAGFKKPEEIWATNHALIMPSRYEGLPLTIIEAMLCGRIAAATNVGGNAEVIENNVTGFITEAPTVVNIQEMLERLWERRLDLKQMGAIAGQHIRRLVPLEPAIVFSDALQRLAAA